MSLVFNLLESPLVAIEGVISIANLGANAEISAYSAESGFLYTVGGGSGAVVVSDLRNPASAQAVSVARPDTQLQTLQSAAVSGNLLAIAVEDSVGTGFVQFYDLTNPAIPVHVSTVTVGALPDAVKFSADGSKLLVTNEGEPNSLYTIDPEGSISVIDTSSYLAATPVAPSQADVQTVGFAAWEGRRAELINRGIRIGTRLGVTTTVAQDIEPEAVAISEDGNTGWISLQENSAIAVLDLSGAVPVVSTIFSAGIKDWSRGIPSATNFSVELEYANGEANRPEGVQAGGLSGLFFAGRETVAGQELDIYYSITDRGPNGDLIAGRRQFLDPDFQPTIYKLGKDRSTGSILELDQIGLNRANGTPLTGLPQLPGIDDTPIDANNQELAFDPFGIDSETVSIFDVTIAGESRKVFAVGDEYRGQIALFDFTTGNLIQRYIPAGQKALLEAQHPGQIGAETIDSLPAVYANRMANRGIEAMALNSEDGLLYAFMQSPLDVVTEAGARSRSRSELTRILAIDPATGVAVKEHFYLLSGRPGQDKLGDAVFDPARGVFYVLERDSGRDSLIAAKHVYEVDLRGATDTLALTTATNQATDGWLAAIGVAQPENLDNRRVLIDHDSDPTTPDIFSLSSADVLANAAIRVAYKAELFNLPSIGGSLAFDKAEGLALRDDGALVINYDNDFGTEGASGNTITVVNFDGIGLDSSDLDVNGSQAGGNRYFPISGLPVYGLTMPDGIATFTDPQGRRFLLAAGEGDSRVYPGDDVTVDGALIEEGGVFSDLTRASSGDPVRDGTTPFRDHPGVAALNAAFEAATGISSTRLNLLNDYGDIDGDGLIDKPFTIGSRSLRIFDDQGNVVFDSGNQLEELANSLGLMARNRDDDKGTEPEMVEIATVAGRTYAFVALERTTTSVAAVFDVTDPYHVVAVDPVVFPGSNRIEGITFLRSEAGEPAGVVASSEGNNVVSITTAEALAAGSAFKLQLFHLSDQEGNISSLDDAPRLSGVLNALRAQDIDLDGIPGFTNTLTLSSGDAYIPGLFYGASAQAYGGVGRGDVLIQNALGVQAIAFGNHEFDQGTAIIKDLIGGATGFAGTAFPYLSGNLNFSADANLAGLVVADGLAPKANSITGSVIFDVNGEKVGVVGFTTPVLRTISSPGSGIGIAPSPFSPVPTPAELDALAAVIQADVDALTAANPGMNKVILLAHMQQLDIELALAERLQHVDIIVAGGSNTRLFDSNDTARPGDSTQGTYPIFKNDADGKPVAVVNTDGNYKYLGRLVLDFDAAGNIIPGSYDPTISGAFRTDDAGVALLEQTTITVNTATTTAAVLNEALQGNIYFNIHSTTFPAGELRGQLAMASDTRDTSGVGMVGFTSILNGANEVQTPPVVTNAHGTGRITFTVAADGSVAYTSSILISNFDAVSLTVGHLHNAPAGINGPVVVNLLNDARANGRIAGGTNAEAFIDARVQEVVDNLREVIIAQEFETFGVSEVFLNGARNPGVRSEETNLGNLTADANLAYARQIDPTVQVSLKNGGGIRNSIGQQLIPTGSVDGKPDLLPTAAVFDALGNLVKPEGGISRNDIANALSFNNGLSLVSVTATELKGLIEHGIAAGEGNGRFPQVGGMAFSYDFTRPAGSRLVTLAIEDANGNDIDIMVRGGEVVGDPSRTVRMVTLNFLASGGDGFPFASLSNPNRVDIIEEDAPATGTATFAPNGSEQDALAEFLVANHSPANPFTEADTAQPLDTRLQNLAMRSDAVVDPVRLGIAGDDTTKPGASTIPGFDGRLDTVFTGAGNDTVDIEITGGSGNTVFTGSGADVVFAGSRDVINGGSGIDQIWATGGDSNRLSGGSGDDDFIIGSARNRVLGGAGNDVFTILEGAGTNFLNGGTGADQFWLVSAVGDLPGAKQFVMDFTPGEDLVGLRGVAFDALSFTQVGGDTLLRVMNDGAELGHFVNLSATALNNLANFVLA